MSDHSEWRELAPAFVLGALSEGERRAFEAALAASPELQREVAAYREVTAALAESEAVPPPAGLRARVLARARDGADPPDARARGRSGREVVLWFALAASVALAVGLGLEVRNLRHAVGGLRGALAQADEARGVAQRRLDALLQPGVELIVLSSAGEQPPGVQVFWNRMAHTATLHAFRLPPAPAGQVYQLWVIQDGVPVPSQTFNSEADGRVLVEDIAVPADGRIEAYAVTREPAGGSRVPTPPILLVGRARTE
jgi:anti-sigma-K factor RskA